MVAGANPVFRHYQALPTSTAAATFVNALPANRVLVVSKLSIANVQGSSAGTATLGIGSTNLIAGLSLNPGEQWTETGLVVLATETVYYQMSLANVFAIHIFGEEVDAS